MDWRKGYTSKYYLAVVDPATWQDVARLDILKAGTIDRSLDYLMESCNLDLIEMPFSGETWIRLYLEANQERGGTITVPLFTGLVSVPSRELNGFHISYSVDCYSVLKVADDILMQRGSYIPAEVDGPRAVQRLLSIGPAPVVIDGADEYPKLTNAIIAENGETNLTMAMAILMTIGWRLRIDGDGTVHICPYPDSYSSSFGASGNDVVEMQVSDDYDWFSCPNVLRVIYGDLTEVARDDDPESPLSTVSRGREIWMEETPSAISSYESLIHYANRRLRELQSPARSIKYDRRFDPDVYVGDKIYMNYPQFGLSGEFKITSQRITLGHNAKTSEEATSETY